MRSSRQRSAGAAAALLALLAVGAGCGKAEEGTGKGSTVAQVQPMQDLPARAQSGARAKLVEPEIGAPAVTEIDGVPAAEDRPADLVRDPEEDLAIAPAGTAAAGPSPGAPTDAQVKAELAQFDRVAPVKAQVLRNGQAVAPRGAPTYVQEMIAAGNAIARLPYIWGGGHARLYDAGYDCSGSLSFAFIHADLLDRTMAAGWSKLGAPGQGEWLSWYYNSGHVFMVVAGLRFDTSALHLAGSRWTTQPRSVAGFKVRHFPEL